MQPYCRRIKLIGSENEFSYDLWMELISGFVSLRMELLSGFVSGELSSLADIFKRLKLLSELAFIKMELVINGFVSKRMELKYRYACNRIRV